MQTVLGVWAHPDDEAYLSAGLMAKASRLGHRVVVVTATRGEGAGDRAVRTREMHASLHAVGVREHVFLDVPDGRCTDVPLALGARRVQQLVESLRPDTILTFGPDGITGHPDHRAVSAWTSAAWQASGHRGRLLHATLTPAFHERWGELTEHLGMWMSDERPATSTDEVALTVRCAGTVLDRKMAALRAHASQTDALRRTVGEATYRRMWQTEWFAEVGEVARERRSA